MVRRIACFFFTVDGDCVVKGGDSTQFDRTMEDNGNRSRGDGCVVMDGMRRDEIAAMANGFCAVKQFVCGFDAVLAWRRAHKTG